MPYKILPENQISENQNIKTYPQHVIMINTHFIKINEINTTEGNNRKSKNFF